MSLAILELHVAGPLFKRLSKDQALVRLRERFLADPEHFKKHPHELLQSELLVRTVARQWAEQASHDLRTMEQIRAGVIDASAIMVRYEHLHADPDGERAKMYRFLGLDPSEAEPLTSESGTKPGLQSDDHRSDKRKGVVGDWTNYFTESATRWFKEETGETLVALGYEAGAGW
ncbi:MAG: sulfotransferase domain-containing protein [Phycisphaerales bacterium]|nr:sulfotransferase domain-containing protein [Phycisphaerales bacterium]